MLALTLAVPAFALEESDVEAAVSSSSREAVAGNVLVWFLCAVGFLKVSQKIDSFMASIGVNVGHTGGSMLGEAMVAFKGVSLAAGAAGKAVSGFTDKAHAGGKTASGSSGFLQGGLAGVVSRKITNDAVRTATQTTQKASSSTADAAYQATKRTVNAERQAASVVHQSKQTNEARTAQSTAHQQTVSSLHRESQHSVGLGGRLFANSLLEGGRFANDVIGMVAAGDLHSTGSITGEFASQALSSYDGYLYTWAYTTKVEHPYLESKSVTETVTVNTAKNDLAQILAELSPSMPYEKDGFSGELALDHTTLSTEASGYTTKYSKTTETKVIGNLDRNDMSYVPATTIKNGKTLSLANVEWQVTGTALVGEALVPAQYQAVATYSASNIYQAATGYVTMAEYHGTVTAEGVDSITYTVVYTGSEIVPEKTYIWDNGSLSAPLLILTALLLCAGITAAVLILLRRRRNVYVYVPGSSPREYRLIAKFRVEPDSEVPAIDAGSLALNPGDTVAVEVKKSLARHLAGREFTVSFPQSDHTYTIQSSKHNDWHEFTVPAEEEQEAPV